MTAALITGGAGFIGSHVADALLARGRRVVVVDDLSAGARAVVPAGAAFIQGDVGDRALMRQVIDRHRVDTVLHFAGSVSVAESLQRPGLYYRNNTANTAELVAAVAETGVPNFVFSSTAAVYGPPEGDAVDEAHPTRPVTPYGASKLMSERLIADAAAAHGFSYAILRYFNVAGADPARRAVGPLQRSSHLVRICIDAALGRLPHVDVYGHDYPTPDGTCVRDYIHVLDLADLHVEAMLRLQKGAGRLLFNCGYGEGRSVLEVVEAVRRVSGVRFAVRDAPRRPGDVARMVASAERARRDLGWRPRREALEAIVADTLAREMHTA